MPNHCKNKLTVIGSEVEAFVDAANGPVQHYWPDEVAPTSVFSFHKLIPLPASVIGGKYDPDGYRAELATWGVKWGGYEEKLLSCEPGVARYAFTTAWAPPEKFLLKLSEKWLSFTFALSYAEEYPSRGRMIVRAGVIEHINDPQPKFPRHNDGCDEDGSEDGSVACTKCAALQAWEEELYRSHDDWVKAAI